MNDSRFATYSLVVANKKLWNALLPELNHARRNRNRLLCTIFFHPDFYCRLRNFTESCLAARGLYHRWGISPRPEDLLFKFSLVYYRYQKMSIPFSRLPTPFLRKNDLPVVSFFLRNYRFYQGFSRFSMEVEKFLKNLPKMLDFL